MKEIVGMSGIAADSRLFDMLVGREPGDAPIESMELSDLPSEYAPMVAEHAGRVPKDCKENVYSLTCKVCGKKDEYDVGLIGVNPWLIRNWHLLTDDSLDGDEDYDHRMAMIADNIQCNGYFRCRHCNSAGQWTFPAEFPLVFTIALLPVLRDP